VTIVVIGVTGAGKTTIGRLLAQRLAWDFLDADDFHPAANVDKMRRGIPLDDEDRKPWLERLRAEIAEREASRRSFVLACSALKEEYRKMLAVGPQVKFVYLKGSKELIAERLHGRREHFANEKILAGQFADLEEPKSGIVVDISAAPEEIVREIRDSLDV
jgi:gluconokinase